MARGLYEDELTRAFSVPPCGSSCSVLPELPDVTKNTSPAALRSDRGEIELPEGSVASVLWLPV